MKKFFKILIGIVIISLIVGVPFAIKKIRRSQVESLKQINQKNEELIGDIFSESKVPKNSIYKDKVFYLPIKNTYVTKDNIGLEIGKTSQGKELNSEKIALRDMDGVGESAFEKVFKTKYDNLICARDKNGFGGQAYSSDPSKYALDLSNKDNRFFFIEDPNISLEMTPIKNSSKFVKTDYFPNIGYSAIVVQNGIFQYLLEAQLTTSGQITFKYNNEYFIFITNEKSQE